MKKILIIDDQEDILEILSFYIEGNFTDVEVIEAYNGNDAVDILEDEDIDSIICDYRMPGGDGKIVFDYNFPDKLIPFAWHSATFSIDSEKLTNKESFDYEVLPKPVTEEELTASIKTMLGLGDVELTYFKVKTSIIKNINNDTFKVYTKVGSKYILMDEDIFDPERIEQYEVKGLTHFYLEESDFQRIGKSLIENLQKKIDECGTLEDVYFVTSDIVDSFNSQLVESGVDLEKIALANSCAEKCLTSLNGNNNVKKMMAGVIDQTNYISSHSLLSIQLASLICSDRETLSHVANISILHDLLIKNERLARIETSDSCYKDLSTAEQKVVLEHGRDMCATLKNLDISEEVLWVIENHHNIKDTEQRKMALLFSIVHEISHTICSQGLEKLSDKILEMKNRTKNHLRKEYLNTLEASL